MTENPNPAPSTQDAQNVGGFLAAVFGGRGASEPVDINDVCALHGYEPIPDGCFRVCGKCHHAYATAEDLIHEENRLRDELRLFDGIRQNPCDSVADILCCPLCSHDW